jgi:hypothetical protein
MMRFEDSCTQAGGAFQGEGTGCEPNLCPQPPTGACCIDNGCSVTTEGDCAGDWLGADTDCEPNLCPQFPIGACCFANGTCEIHTGEYCGSLGGSYQGDATVCEPNPCPQPTGACCFAGGTCEVRTQESCNADGGSYRGDGTDCNPNPCTTGPCRGLARAIRTLSEPPLLHAGGGGNNPYDPADGDGVVCWSQGPNLDGLIASSEVIGAFGLETELANDFLPNAGGYIDNARWWGGYYNYIPGDPLVCDFNLRFYDDAGCVPGAVICEYIIVSNNANETFIYDQFGFPVYEYNWDMCCPVAQDNLYWFVAQAGDHPFPPQWGRLEAAGGVQLCDTVFRSAFFSYPDWVPAVDVFLVSFDCSQEFTCVDGCGTAIERKSWGKIKALFGE